MSRDLELLKWYDNVGVKRVYSQQKIQLESKDKTNISKPIEVIKSSMNDKIMTPRNMKEKSRALCDKANSLDELRDIVINFEGLDIKKTATNTVFADGAVNADVMIIGEAPGANEDLTGIPFCGQSGQLLDKFLAFIGLTRSSNLYVTNTVFWRPPGNRRPTEVEKAVCLPFVEKHIALIKPKLLLLLGSTSAQAILNVNDPITSLRKKEFDYSNKYLSSDIPVKILFHPSYLLRQPSQKKHFWNDLLLIQNQYL